MASTDIFNFTAAGVSSWSPPVQWQPLVGSDQQEAIWQAIEQDGPHCLVDSRAGCGKSTTIRESTQRIKAVSPKCRMTYLAFNKSIADEFRQGLPAGVNASTMHSAGYSALRKAYPNLGELDPHKAHKLSRKVIRGRGDDASKARTSMVRLSGLCMGNLSDGRDRGELKRCSTAVGISIPKDFEDDVLDGTPELLDLRSTEFDTIDYDDMVHAPVARWLPFPELDRLYVDELQDLSPCQHSLIRLMVGKGQLTVVGDPKQAIYAFRGAASQSMALLAGHLKTTERGLISLPLTKTRRCPRSVVRLVKKLVPDFESLPGSPEGQVISANPREILRLMVPGVLALARTNAPLVQEAYRLFLDGIPVAIQGRDLGATLIGIIESLGSESIPELIRDVDAQQEDELAALESLDASDELRSLVIDRCECIRQSARGALTVAEVIGRIRHLFREIPTSEQGSFVTLSSIHRAKGREADTVVILRPDLIPHRMATSPEAKDQELNLAYVAATRTKRLLAIAGPIPSVFSV